MTTTIEQMASDLKKHWDNVENTNPPKDYAVYYLWKKFKTSFKNCLDAYYIAYE